MLKHQALILWQRRVTWPPLSVVSSSVLQDWDDSGCQDLVFTQGSTVRDLLRAEAALRDAEYSLRLMIEGHVLPSHVLLTSSEYVLAQTTKKRGAVC